MKIFFQALIAKSVTETVKQKDIKVEQNGLDKINATENSSSTEKSKGMDYKIRYTVSAIVKVCS